MRATNYVKATYQEVYDISTKQDCVSFMAFHTPTEFGPYHMLHGFFSQYRKYKYGGMKVTVVPAAQLPADPLQVSYEAGESVIDPRDLQNPVLFHGAHGNNIGDVLNFIYGDRATVPTTSVDYYQQSNTKPLVQSSGVGGTLEEWYYSSMLDPSFRKFNVMSNMQLPFMSPRVHNLTTNISIQPNQINPTNTNVIYPQVDLDATTTDDARDAYLKDFIPTVSDLGSSQVIVTRPVSEVQLMTNRLSKLGWMDTFTFQKEGSASDSVGTMSPTVSPLPKLMMGVLILPPCYKTKLAFRVIISHYFHFYKFNTSITPTLVGPSTNHESQFNENYYSFLPHSAATAASLAETNSIDALNGDVKQSFSGVV